MVVRIDDLPISRAAAMRNPHARTGTHNRFKGGDNPAGRHLDFDILPFPIVEIRLTVGHDQHFVSGKMIMQDGFQGRRRPAHLALIPHAFVRFKLPNDRTKILRDRVEVGVHAAYRRAMQQALRREASFARR